MCSKLLPALLTLLSANLGICNVGDNRPLPKFGRSMRSEFFMDTDFVQLNHGSYGPLPRAVHAAMIKLQERAERNPDLWIRRDSKNELVRVRLALAKQVHANTEDVVVVPNASTGLNAALRSIIFFPGDRIFHLSTLYDTVQGIVRFVLDAHNGTVSKVVLNVTFPMTNAEVLKKLDAFLKETDDPTRPIRVAVIDHISAMPTVINPIEKMIPMLKQRNITVIVDGAHALGSIPINVTAFGADYYITNCHKWFYGPRGTSVLYVNKKLQATTHPVVATRYYTRPSDFLKEFWWQGTISFVPYIAIPASIEFRENVGGEQAIMEYNHNLAYQGGLLVATRLGTRVLQQKDQIAGMVDVQLPVKNPNDSMLTFDWWVDKQLTNYTNTFAPVYKHNGVWWTRLSAQIYNDMTDFQLAAKHFLDICNELAASQK